MQQETHHKETFSGPQRFKTHSAKVFSRTPKRFLRGGDTTANHEIIDRPFDFGTDD